MARDVAVRELLVFLNRQAVPEAVGAMDRSPRCLDDASRSAFCPKPSKYLRFLSAVSRSLATLLIIIAAVSDKGQLWCIAIAFQIRCCSLRSSWRLAQMCSHTATAAHIFGDASRRSARARTDLVSGPDGARYCGRSTQHSNR